MKIGFFGTPAFAAHILQTLLEHHIQVVAVVTQTDKPQGRSLQYGSSAVKQFVQSSAPHLLLLQPEKASNPLFLEELTTFNADLFVVVAYGQILSQKLLNIPPLGCINVHASLLPKYRGAAPIQRSLMNGDTETGIAIQKMVYQLDAGDVIREARLPIHFEMNFGELEQKLCELAKPLLLSVLQLYEGGIPEGKPQDPSGVTIAQKIKPEETQIHWDQGSIHLHNVVRSLSPRPGAWCWIQVGGERKRLKILKATPSEHTGLAGELVLFQGGQCIVATAKGSLQILQVQPEGKKAMSVQDWMRGLQAIPTFCLF